MKRIYNILYITAFPPNQKTGGQFFSMNALMEISSEHTVDLIYFAYPGHECEIKVGSGIRSVTEQKIGGLDFLKKPFIHPLFTRRFSKKLLKKFRAIASQYDILYFDFSQVALYSLYIKHPYKVIRMHDVLCQKFERKNKFLHRWVSATERKIVKSCLRVLVPSEKDSGIIKETYGVNADYTNEYLKKINWPENTEQKDSFLFYGYWKRPENTEGLIWFFENVVPLCKKKHTFVIIGDGLDVSQYECLGAANISYLGFVKDPLDGILSSKAVVVPLFQGAGVKVKVVDSFTAGTPVIGTDLAFEGLPHIEGLCFQEDSAQEFADALDGFVPVSYPQKQHLAAEFRRVYDCRHLLECLDNPRSPS